MLLYITDVSTRAGALLAGNALFAILAFFALVIVALSSVGLFSQSWKKIIKGLFSASVGKLHDAYRSSRVFHALGRLLVDGKCPRGLPHLDPFERVSDSVVRVLGCNPGSHTLQGTNTWLVGRDESKILIDAGEDITSSTYVTMLLDVIFPLTETKRLRAILLTHGHGDHQGGVVRLLQQLRERDRIAGIKHVPPLVYKRMMPGGGNFPHVGFACNQISEGQSFVASPGVTLRAVYSPGHTDDHVCFVLEVRYLSRELHAFTSVYVLSFLDYLLLGHGFNR
jgi:Metallo-beta-lactamase superfamily